MKLRATFIAVGFTLTSPVISVPNVMPKTVNQPLGHGPDPGPQGTIDAINRWRDDVIAINKFMDVSLHGNVSDLANAAMDAIKTANDEVTNFNILQGLDDFPSFSGISAAIDTLQREITGLSQNQRDLLNGIVDNVQKNLDPVGIKAVILEKRCCNILPAIEMFWTTVASDEGVSDRVDLRAPRPSAACQPENGGKFCKG